MKMNQTKKNLTWKLKEAPTAEGLSKLVAQGVLRPEEAREMVAGTAENDKEKIEALEKLVEFLQNLVTELSKNKGGTTFIPYTQTVYIDRPVRRYWDQYWMSTEKVLCKAGLNLSSSTLSTTAGSNNLAFYNSGSSGSTVNASLGMTTLDTSASGVVNNKIEALSLSVGKDGVS